MYNRGTMICLSVTGISALLLFFYFKNKIFCQDKLDKLTRFIEDYNNNNGINVEQRRDFVVSEQLPETVDFSHVEEKPLNKELIEVSDEEEEDSDSDDSVDSDNDDDDDDDDDKNDEEELKEKEKEDEEEEEEVKEKEESEVKKKVMMKKKVVKKKVKEER